MIKLKKLYNVVNAASVTCNETTLDQLRLRNNFKIKHVKIRCELKIPPLND